MQAFPSMSKESSMFYSRVFAEIMLNLHAVKQGLYPKLLCEMDSPHEAYHWRENIKVVMLLMAQRRGNWTEGEK